MRRISLFIYLFCCPFFIKCVKLVFQLILKKWLNAIKFQQLFKISTQKLLKLVHFVDIIQWEWSWIRSMYMIDCFICTFCPVSLWPCFSLCVPECLRALLSTLQFCLSVCKWSVCLHVKVYVYLKAKEMQVRYNCAFFLLRVTYFAAVCQTYSWL